MIALLGLSNLANLGVRPQEPISSYFFSLTKGLSSGENQLHQFHVSH